MAEHRRLATVDEAAAQIAPPTGSETVLADGQAGIAVARKDVAAAIAVLTLWLNSTTQLKLAEDAMGCNGLRDIFWLARDRGWTE
jgi:hypothetical protein